MLKILLKLLILIPLLARAETFVPGKDYEIIKSTDLSSKAKGQVKVTEFFSYGCPWCYRIEGSLNNWVKQHDKQIEFSRIPVVFSKDWTFYAKAYYTAELLGLGAKLNPVLFRAIQTEKQPLNSNQTLIDFFIAQGLDKETAESAFLHSTTIDMKVNEGNSLIGSFHIAAVPAVVISNVYKTDLQMAQGEERFFKILDYLYEKASHEAS